MLQIPLSALPAQTINVVLNNQACTINVYQKFWGLFCDLFVNNQVIIRGVVCQNQNPIVKSLYLGFIGDLMFFDTAGTSDPDFEGLANGNGGRFFFLYLAPADLPDDYGQGPFDPDFNIDINDWVAAFPNTPVSPTGGGSQVLNVGSLR